MTDAPPITLTPTPATVVRFEDLPTRTGPLTLGQLNILRWISDAPESFDTTLGHQFTFPDGVQLADVLASISVLLARHEGLRTVFAAGDPPRQRVLSAGSLELATYDVGPVAPGPDQREQIATELSRRWRPGSACGPTQLPWWIALAVGQGQVYAGSVRFSHLVVDEQAVEVLRREFAELIGGPATLRVPGPARLQPVDQAEREAGQRLRARADRALRYRDKLLRQMPPCLYPAPHTDTPGESVAVDLHSEAAAFALRRLAARTGRNRPSAMLAAVCALLHHRTGEPRLVFPTLASNRFDPALRDYVGTLVQIAFARIDVASASFDDLVRRAWLAVVAASERGMYDVARSAEIDRLVGLERGLHFAFEPLFNSPIIDTADEREPPPMQQVSDALATTTLTRHAMRRTHTMLRFDLYDYHDVVHLRLWSGDTGRLPVEAAEALLLALERLLVAAADSDLEPPQMARVLGLAALTPGPDWLRVDSCWVELSEVQRLLDDALAPAQAQIFPVVDGRPLVAYVAGDAVRTPQEAHARCMAALPSRHTAIAPRYYILCDTAPENPTDLAGWRSVRDEGSGRITVTTSAAT